MSQTQLDTSRRWRTIGRMIDGLVAEFPILKCLESLAPLVSFNVPLNRSYPVYLWREKGTHWEAVNGPREGQGYKRQEMHDQAKGTHSSSQGQRLNLYIWLLGLWNRVWWWNLAVETSGDQVVTRAYWRYQRHCRQISVGGDPDVASLINHFPCLPSCHPYLEPKWTPPLSA